MNNQNYSISIIIFVLFIITYTNSGYTQYNSRNNSGNLPDADLYSKLKDESGNKLFPDDGDAIQNSGFSGDYPSGKFGYSVSSAGEVNADGYSDLIISAPDYL